MTKNEPTPDELDALSNKMLRTKRCPDCGTKISGGFTGLVQHLKDAHGKS